MLLVEQQEGHPACKKWVGWWRWALVSPDGVAPIRMVSVSASVDLPLHHKVQKFSSGTGLPGWSRKKGCKMVVVCGGGCIMTFLEPIACFIFSQPFWSVFVTIIVLLLFVVTIIAIHHSV